MTEIYNFNQDDLMTEDVFILDCHSDIYIWVGQQVESKNKMQALAMGEVCFKCFTRKFFHCLDDYELLNANFCIYNVGEVYFRLLMVNRHTIGMSIYMIVILVRLFK